MFTQNEMIVFFLYQNLVIRLKKQNYFSQISREKNQGVDLVEVKSNEGVKIDV